MADLFQVSVFATNHTTSLIFQYDQGEKASQAYESIRDMITDTSFPDAVEIVDGFGVKAIVARAWVSAVLLTHVNRQLDGQRAGQLLAQRANAQLQQDVASDPVLKLIGATPAFRGNPQMQRG